MKIFLAIFMCCYYKFYLIANDVEDRFATLSLSPIEKNLTANDWIEVINSIVSSLQTTFHPGINQQRIDSFKEEMLNDHNLSIVKLQKAIKKNFAVGHIGIVRNDLDIDELKKIMTDNYPEKTSAHVFAIPYKGKVMAYLYNEKKYSYEDIKGIINNSKINTLNIINTKDGDIPLLKITSFKGRKGYFYKELEIIREKIAHHYPYIIIDLRDNEGGKLTLTYSFLANFLEEKTPDIRPVTVHSDFFIKHHIPATTLEENIRLASHYFYPFYEDIDFGSYKSLIEESRLFSKEISFKKMVVLINKNTFSGGEIAAATLKSTLGSKICLLGMPASGSFEETGEAISLPHKFTLHLPGSKRFFYSVRTRTLLTGLRLYPDIEYQDGPNIIEKAINILMQPNLCPNDASYRPM